MISDFVNQFPLKNLKRSLFSVPETANSVDSLALSGRLESMAATAAEHGMQYTFPMLDIDLVNYMLSCPAPYLEQLAHLEKDARLHQYVDFAYIRKRLKALPDYEKVPLSTERASLKGEQAKERQGNTSFLAISTIETLQQWLDEEERS